MDAILGKVCVAAEILDLVLALEDRYKELPIFDVAHVQAVHPGIVSAVGQHFSAFGKRIAEGFGHAQDHERGRLAPVLVRPREPFRVGFNDA